MLKFKLNTNRQTFN